MVAPRAALRMGGAAPSRRHGSRKDFRPARSRAADPSPLIGDLVPPRGVSDRRTLQPGSRADGVRRDRCAETLRRYEARWIRRRRETGLQSIRPSDHIVAGRHGRARKARTNAWYQGGAVPPPPGAARRRVSIVGSACRAATRFGSATASAT